MQALNYATLADFQAGCATFSENVAAWRHASQNGNTPTEVRAMYADLEHLKQCLDRANLVWKSPRQWREEASPDHEEGKQRFALEQGLGRTMGVLIAEYAKYVSSH